MVDVKTDSFAIETGITDVTGNDLGSISCLGELFTKSGQDLTVDVIALTMSRAFPSGTVWTKTRSTPQ